MVRARRLELDCRDSFATAAAAVLRVRSEEVFEQAAGVLDLARPERVHDMRVATRRLRAAIEVFEVCFPRRAVRAALRDVKALADGLGERRDRDVEIELLEQFVADLGAQDRGRVGALIASLREEQRGANLELASLTSAAHLVKLRRRLARLGEGITG